MDEYTVTAWQRALVDFLRTDCSLAFVFLETAAIANPRNSKIALENARVALKAIRHFAVRVEDPGIRTEIECRADELETAIGRFPV